MVPASSLLIITQTPSLAERIKKSLLPGTREIFFSSYQDDILGILKTHEIRVVLVDLDRGKHLKKGKEILRAIKAYDTLIDVLICGASIEEDAVEWIGKGATDFLCEPLQIKTLNHLLTTIDRKRKLRNGTMGLEQKLEKKYSFHGIVGKSPYMLDIFSLIQNIAKHFTSVLITGETGTGKELVARAIHMLSDLKSRKFVVCDCVAIPEHLFESELFGYTKGAFTGADKDKKGLFDSADKGIIFLDEIGEVPVTIQSKLLRVLEHRQFRPLGSNETRTVNVRVIAATSKNLRDGIENGSFREDLYHRLNKVEIPLQPLRKRPEDIPLLVRHFNAVNSKNLSRAVKGISRQVQKLFLKYPWPGNVRELENVLESAALLTKKNFIDISDLPKNLQKYADSLDKIPFIERKELSTLEDLEKDYILHILKITGNNLKKSAKILDISRTTLYSKLKKYGLR